MSQNQQPICYVRTAELEQLKDSRLSGVGCMLHRTAADHLSALYGTPQPVPDFNEGVEAAIQHVRGRFAGRAEGSDVWLEIGKIARGLEALKRPAAEQAADQNGDNQPATRMDAENKVLVAVPLVAAEVSEQAAYDMGAKGGPSESCLRHGCAAIVGRFVLSGTEKAIAEQQRTASTSILEP
jgi:hypothetical protein